MAALNKIICLILAILLLVCPASSQEKNVPDNYPDRYRLRLPEEWMKPKIIRAVTEILPQTIDELKNRGFCTNGKAAYYVFLIVDSLSVNHTGYSFHAALRTYDSLGKIIADLKLISPEEIFDSKQPVSTTGTTNFYSQPEYAYSPAPDSYGNYQRIPITNAPPPVWNDNFINYSSVDLNILGICKSKIFEIRRLLKKINSG
jgi:hypothetical protein